MTVVQLKLQTGNVSTHCERSGEGQAETVLWLHGSGPGVTAWSNWQLALPFFDDKFHNLAPDLVGFGATQHPQDPPTGMRNWMRLWVDQVLALLDELKIEKAHVVGNSMGGA